ncbi:MAG TPA: metallophosphoesterase [Tepidisphaeraceae bacterium]|nr:metallophosphoesterase [Tepidisphaeraceae bacterium]
MRWMTCIIYGLVAACCGVVVAAGAPAPATQALAGEVNQLSMGDWGTDGRGQQAVARAMADYVERTNKNVSGMLLVGDNFYMKLPGGVNDPMWQSAFERMYDPARLNFPFFAALGNHDYQFGKDVIELDYAKTHPASRWKLPARWYRVDIPVDHPLVTVLMLDSDKDPLGPAQWAEQRAWLEAELGKPRGTWTMCCAHHPLFSNGGHGDNGVLQNDWGSLFVKYKVDFYVCGHDHDLQHLQIPNWFTSFVLVGGGGQDTKLMRHDDRGPMSRLTHGFAHFEITPESAVVRYVNDEGKVIHQFTRDKGGRVTVQIEGGHDKAAGNPLRALEGFGGFKPPVTTQPAGAAGD